MKSILVGSHFVPPASMLLQVLPAGAELVLLSDHDNPYDDRAIMVCVAPEEVPEALRVALDCQLPSMGSSWAELEAQGLVKLGHVARTGGKPLLKAQAQLELKLSGTEEFRAAIAEAWPAKAKLGFSGMGLPMVELEDKA